MKIVRFRRDRVDVIQEREEVLAVSQRLVRVSQRRVNCETEQQWGQRVTLFDPFCLRDTVDRAVLIPPRVS